LIHQFLQQMIGCVRWLLARYWLRQQTPEQVLKLLVCVMFQEAR